MRPFGLGWWLGEGSRFPGGLIRSTKEGRKASMGSDRDQGVAATRATVRLPEVPEGSDQDVRWG